MNLGLNGLVALIMAVALSACATVGSSPADTAAADTKTSSKSLVSDEPECD